MGMPGTFSRVDFSDFSDGPCDQLVIYGCESVQPQAYHYAFFILSQISQKYRLSTASSRSLSHCVKRCAYRTRRSSSRTRAERSILKGVDVFANVISVTRTQGRFEEELCAKMIDSVAFLCSNVILEQSLVR
jgi:hypothetical protein